MVYIFISGSVISIAGVANFFLGFDFGSDFFTEGSLTWTLLGIVLFFGGDSYVTILLEGPFFGRGAGYYSESELEDLGFGTN